MTVHDAFSLFCQLAGDMSITFLMLAEVEYFRGGNYMCRLIATASGGDNEGSFNTENYRKQPSENA